LTGLALHFTVAVWGDEYVQTLLGLALPSFLAPGNIPACAARRKCIFEVHTRPADVAAIRSSEAWRELSMHAHAVLRPTLTDDVLARGNRYSAMSFCHRQAIAAALAERSVLSILSPDCIAADGSFAAALDVLEHGKRAVLVAGPRGELETIAPALEERFRSGTSAAIVISPRPLISLLMSHLHPMSERLFWGARQFTVIPSAVYWRAGRASLLAKYFHLHPLFVDLSAALPSAGQDAGTVDGPFLRLAGIPEDEVHVVSRSDQIALIELSRREHDWMAGYPSMFKTWRVLHWAMTHAEPAQQDRFLCHDICLQGEEDVDWEAMRRSVKRAILPLRLALSIARRAPYVYRVVRALWPPIARLVLAMNAWLRNPWSNLRQLFRKRMTRWKLLGLTFVAPEIARRAGWLYWPLMRLCLRSRVRFLVNIPANMGHNTVELDHYLRARATATFPADLRVVLFRQPNAMHAETANLYARHFWWAPTSRLAYLFLLPLTMRFHRLILDGGLSRLKWQLREDLTYERPIENQTYLYQVDKATALEKWRSYYRLRATSPASWPLAGDVGMDEELRAFLDFAPETKLALFHMKLELSNASGAASTAEAYLPAMRFLRAHGYRLVFVGREAMPSEFSELGVLNYAQSSIASYRHDIQIFKAAAIAVTAGSGIAFLPDCLGTPYVYADSWHIGMPTFSERCVIVPALVRERTGRMLSLSEQADLYWSLADEGHEAFPRERYEARNASGDEILEAAKEALALRQTARPLTTLQQCYQALDARSLLPLTRARVSAYFAEKHNHLFNAALPATASERSA